MSKKIILLILIVGIGIIGYFSFNGNSVEIYIDGENVSSSSIISPTSGVNTDQLNMEICDYVFKNMDSTKGDGTTLKQDIQRICAAHGLNNVNVRINSVLGENKIPIQYHVDGKSMDPTLKDGQIVLVEKTKNIRVNDIVVADSPEYGRIIKRVNQINGDNVYLVSDNKNVTYERVNGALYETKGITTWVNIDNIYGVAVEY